MENELVTKSSTGVFTLRVYYEYLLVLNLPADIYAQVQQEKKYFFDRYKESVAVKTWPGIIVANFLAMEEMEDTFTRYMHRIFSTQKVFAVTLNNYSGFPPHTIYARVQDHKPFRKLVSELAPVYDYIKSNGCPPAKSITPPHVTIARKLGPEVYEKAMFDYSQKTFHACFEVTELVLLKRQNQYDKCKEVNVFKLLTG